MAGRFNNPYPQFFDSTPNVYSGGTLTFYASGTSSLQDVYTDQSLTTPASNPLTLNAAGRPAVDVFLQDLAYKVVLADANGNVIWTADPVRARDSTYIAKTLTGSGTPQGNVAGTAGSATVLPDQYWDYTNSILYFCTTTGTASTAIWTAINASASNPSIPPPQGRLTLTSATPVLTTDTSSIGQFFYTPFVGNLVPIYNGTTMIPTEFSEIGVTLVSAHAANTIYDVFVFSNSGVLTLVTGPAWSSSTAGSCSRGSGASTTELTRVKGIWVNAVAITGRNGSSTYSIGANLATYLGSIYVDSSAGLLTCNLSYGQNRKWGVWNAYNRVPIKLIAGDSTASWTNPGSLRSSNNNSANKLTVFCGLAEEIAEVSFVQTMNAAFSSQTCTMAIGIGLNTASSVGKVGAVVAGNTSTAGSVTADGKAEYLLTPRLGINNILALESSNGGTATFSGGNDDMVLSATWRG